MLEELCNPSQAGPPGSDILCQPVLYFRGVGLIRKNVQAVIKFTIAHQNASTQIGKHTKLYAVKRSRMCFYYIYFIILLNIYI